MVQEHIKLIGRKGTYAVDTLNFEVTIKDVKTAYGNVLVLINPVAGSGQKWVNVNSVKLEGK